MGDAWLPERLVDTNLDGDMLFLEFDNAPEDNQGDEEGRGFVEHEIAMIREKLELLLDEPSDTKTKADALLAIFLMGHELSSSEVIEILESTESEMTEFEPFESEIAEHKTTESDSVELEASKLETTKPDTNKLETKELHDD